MYSAIKVNGKKLYEYARDGKQVEVKPRQIEIYNIKITNINLEKKQVEFIVECSKGTYVRTLCENIAEKIGTVGYMKELNRLRVGKFDIEKAITISELETYNKEELEKHIITMEKMFKNKPKINLNNEELNKFLNGVKIQYTQLENKQEEICNIYNGKKYIGIGIIKQGIIKRDIVI